LKTVTSEVVDLKKKMSKTTHLYNANRREKRKLKRLKRQKDVIKELNHEKDAMACTLQKLEKNLQAENGFEATQVPKTTY
jgi:cell shape-determining protein MreC